MQTITATTIPTNVKVSVSNYEISKLAQRLIRLQYGWGDKYSVVNENLVNSETFHTSHSFDTEEHIRIATEQDIKVQTALDILKKIY
jgi:hypothetical protein